VSYACPWAHRTLIVRALKQLQDIIDVYVVHPLMGENGWEFAAGDGCKPDPEGRRFLWQLYVQADSKYTGRVTVPVLWDTQENAIVNNESGEIIRIFNTQFNTLTDNTLDLYPLALREQIDAMNQRIYDEVNNGVYKAGFATTQQAYNEAVNTLFSCLDDLEQRLSHTPYLVGEQATEADWRLFTTLVRFDAVYVGHFKCNLRRLLDYPYLLRYIKRLYDNPAVADTCRFDHIKQHYYKSHKHINPTGIVPAGPEHLGFIG
ncbi:MAG: glutathione S-transferase family protein, partial [Myxococcota bacterium]